MVSTSLVRCCSTLKLEVPAQSILVQSFPLPAVCVEQVSTTSGPVTMLSQVVAVHEFADVPSLGAHCPLPEPPGGLNPTCEPITVAHAVVVQLLDAEAVAAVQADGFATPVEVTTGALHEVTSVQLFAAVAGVVGHCAGSTGALGVVVAVQVVAVQSLLEEAATLAGHVAGSANAGPVVMVLQVIAVQLFPDAAVCELQEEAPVVDTLVVQLVVTVLVFPEKLVPQASTP